MMNTFVGYAWQRLFWCFHSRLVDACARAFACICWFCRFFYNIIYLCWINNIIVQPPVQHIHCMYCFHLIVLIKLITSWNLIFNFDFGLPIWLFVGKFRVMFSSRSCDLWNGTVWGDSSSLRKPNGNIYLAIAPVLIIKKVSFRLLFQQKKQH